MSNNTENSIEILRNPLNFRFDISWQMLEYHLTNLENEFLSCEKTKWPFEERPMYELAAWLNLELMKNASEIGCGRFLYALRKK